MNEIAHAASLAAVQPCAAGIVLFVHQSAELYGSDRVLLQMASDLRHSEYLPVVVLPERGPLLTELQRLGIETHVAAVGKITRSMYSPRGFLRWLHGMRASLRAIDAVVHGRSVQLVHSNTLAVFGGAVWARRRRVPHLWHVHEIIHAPRPAAIALPLLARLLSDRVIANSNGTMAWLQQRWPALGARCAVICNGLPPAPPRDDAAAAAFRRQIGASGDELVVALVGRINRGKGHAVLIAAAEELQRQGELNRFRFVCAGGPPPGQAHLQTELEHAMAASPARDRLHLLPFLDDIWPLWYGSDITVVPSTLPESFGLVAAEAMAAGLPVIAAAQGGLLDVVADGDTGLLVAPGDAQQLAQALLQLCDAVVRARLGAAGRRRQQREFSTEAQFRKWISEYDVLAKRKRGMGYATS